MSNYIFVDICLMSNYVFVELCFYKYMYYYVNIQMLFNNYYVNLYICRATSPEPQKDYRSVIQRFKALRVLYTIDIVQSLQKGVNGVLLGVILMVWIEDCWEYSWI